MCHTSCWLRDAGSVVDYMKIVKSWLDANPDQVVTLLLTNGDNRPVKEFGDAIRSAGLDMYAFTPQGDLKLNQWPTLRQFIASGKRLIFFLDYGADTSVEPS